MQALALKNELIHADGAAVKALLARHGSLQLLTLRDAAGQGPLHWCAEAGNLAALAELLANNANASESEVDRFGQSARVIAQSEGHAECAALLASAALAQAEREQTRSAATQARDAANYADSLLAGFGAPKATPAAPSPARVARPSFAEAQVKFEQLLTRARDLAAQGVSSAAAAASSAAAGLAKASAPGPSQSAPEARVAEEDELDHAAAPSAPTAPANAAASQGKEEGEELIPLPDRVKALDPKKQQAYRALIKAGCEDLTERAQQDPRAGREALATKVRAMLAKGQNPLLGGPAGVGKSSLAYVIAAQLAESGKMLIQIPSRLLRGNKYAGSVNESIQKWLPHALILRPDALVFIDDAQVLTTGKTSSDTTDTPATVLAEHLDPGSAKRLTLLAAVNAKDAPLLEEEESLYRLFSPVAVPALTRDETRALIHEPSTRARLKAQGYEIDDEARFGRIVDQALPMLEDFIFNQSFPSKAFEFLAHLLSATPVSAVDEASLIQSFAKFYSIPLELARGEIHEGSAYETLDTQLNEIVIGQEGPLAKLCASIRGAILLNGAGARTPPSFMFMGPTGVGKTETAESISRILSLPILKFSMGELKSAADTRRVLDELSEFLTRNYSGVILFDEVEKASPAVLDLMLNLLDKGSIGSGSTKVDCGAHLVIGTSNIGAMETLNLKKALLARFGELGIDEDWLRQRLIDEGLRPELINRFTRVLDFNFINESVALIIGEKVFAKKAKTLSATRGVSVTFEPSFTKDQILAEFDERFGARGVIRIVNEAFERLISHKLILVKLRRGASLAVSEEAGELRVIVSDAQGSVSEVLIPDARSKDKQNLQALIDEANGRGAPEAPKS